eukprot:TRINITY_DN16411_c1_g3_i3.p1 TRINITY_DN16411_c1_g3~~TRINITY_DN16411_c1_g3_i3.p1  ORF type:complete len:171 (-),score=21.49 TRINITY_DN16411_c1_g3_i3:186-698(-)
MVNSWVCIGAVIMERNDSQPADDFSWQAPDPTEVRSAWLRARAMRGVAERLQRDTPSAASADLDGGSSGSSSTGRSPTMDRASNNSVADIARDLHDRGLCQPCAYHMRKSDGCRKSDACNFCHLCDNARYQFWKRRLKKFKELEEKFTELEADLPDLADVDTLDGDGSAR